MQNKISIAAAKHLKKRKNKEWRFKYYGVFAIGLSLFFLIILFSSIIKQGLPAFTETRISLDIDLKVDQLGIKIDANSPVLTQEMLRSAEITPAIRSALRAYFPELKARADLQRLYALININAEFQIKDYILEHPESLGKTITFNLIASSLTDQFYKNQDMRNFASSDRKITDAQIQMLDVLNAKNIISTQFNTTFFTSMDSRNPEEAGILGALVGSLLTMGITLLLSFPLGVATAIYLQEFAPKNKLTDIIEVNINNLAAVPSIIYGLLGLAIFINFIGLPRSAPIIGGLVLTLMTLPTIIIASRAAISSVPPSIREASFGLGASKMQTVLHHVLPLAMPGMLTGAIIGMARALGETAPLLMIGMVAFIANMPSSIFDPASVLPVQIYLWADTPDKGFIEKTSAAILVLMVFMMLVNLIAVFLRKKFEQRW